MIERPNSQNLVGRYVPKNRRTKGRYRPFWLPASNFYVLAAAVAVAVFFIAWAILNTGEEEMPLILAGLLASAILAGAVILREVILRSARYRLLIAQERLDYNIKTVGHRLNTRKLEKITIEEIREILSEIEKKSKIAESFPNISENHWHVFEICHEYLHRNEKELELVGLGSPRINILRQSREKVQSLHKYHLLIWSSLESRSFIQEAKVSATISKKLENANKALTVLDSAIEFYPDEKELLDSVSAVKEFTANVKVSHWIEQAERFAFKGNYKRAISNYHDALFYLGRENVKSEEKDLIAEKINQEIKKIQKLLNE